MRQMTEVKVDGKTIPVPYLRCDDCGEVIEDAKVPFVEEHLAYTLVHPDEYAEIVHEPTERKGRVKHYCMRCWHAPGSDVTESEKTKCCLAVKRRHDDLQAAAARAKGDAQAAAGEQVQ